MRTRGSAERRRPRRRDIGGSDGWNNSNRWVGAVGSEEEEGGKVGGASPAIEELQICINSGGDSDLLSCEHPRANDEALDGGT